jgi:hypothetical protein
MNRAFHSDFLVAQPSFAAGVARLMDFGCSFDGYNISSSELQADTRAIASDWFNVGLDIVTSIMQFNRENL